MKTSWGEYSALLAVHTSKNRIPMMGQFELTPRCNLSCKMCYVACPANDKSVMEREKTAKEWIQMAYEARDAGMLYLLLTGGEVFLRPDFLSIYDEMSRMGFINTIYTNGTLITSKIASILGNRPPSEINITLYGGSSDTYERLCGDQGAFQKTLRGIDLLLDQGITVQVRTTIVQDNYQDLEQMIELLEKRNLSLNLVNYVSPCREGCGQKPKQVRLSPEEQVEVEARLGIYRYNQKQQESSSTTLQGNPALEEYLRGEESHPFHCSNGKSAFWITWDGKMIPCGLLEEPQTEPFKIGFTNAWKELVEGCAKVPSCMECIKCSLHDMCMTCPARLYSETGSFEKPAPYLCEMAKATQEKINQLRLEEYVYAQSI